MYFVVLEKAPIVSLGQSWGVLWEYGVLMCKLIRANRSLYNQSESLGYMTDCKSDSFPLGIALC